MPGELIASPFVGKWVDINEYFSEVEFTVSVDSDNNVFVNAQDPNDGETAKVSDVVLHADELTFTALWPSTGRITKNRFELSTANQVKLTFNYTDTTTLIRK